MTAADTVRAAKTILNLIGPDPDAATHVLLLRWALGDFCTIPTCPGPHKALGLCERHYRAHHRATRNETHLINRAARKVA